MRLNAAQTNASLRHVRPPFGADARVMLFSSFDDVARKRGVDLLLKCATPATSGFEADNQRAYAAIGG